MFRWLLRLWCWSRNYHESTFDSDTCRCGATWEKDGHRSWWITRGRGPRLPGSTP